MIQTFKHEIAEDIWSLEVYSPLAGDNIWLEIERDRTWLEFSIKQLCSVPAQHQGVLGSLDTQVLFELGFQFFC